MAVSTKIIPEKSGQGIIADTLAKAALNSSDDFVVRLSLRRAEIFVFGAEQALRGGYVNAAAILLRNASYEYGAFSRALWPAYQERPREAVHVDALITGFAKNPLQELASELESGSRPTRGASLGKILDIRKGLVEALGLPNEGVVATDTKHNMEQIRRELEGELRSSQRE